MKLYIFFACLGIITIGQFSSDLYIPSLPAISKDMKVSFGNAQLTVSIYMLGYFISGLVYGITSDFIGRKKTTIIGFCFCIVGSLACFLSTNLESLIVGRLLQGLGSGIALTISFAIMRDVYFGKAFAKYISYLSMAGTIAITCAPFLGGCIQEELSWKYCFLFLVLYSSSILFFIIFKLPETNKHLPENRLAAVNIKKSLLLLFNNRYFIGGSISIFATYSAILGWLTSGSILFQHSFGLTPAKFGFVTLIFGMAIASGCIVNARLVSTYDMKVLIKVGSNIIIITTTIMVLITLAGIYDIYAVIIPIIVFGFGSSFIFSNVRAIVLAEFPDITGVCIALLGGVQILGGIVSSFIVSRVPNSTPLTIAIIFLVCSIILSYSTRLLSSWNNYSI